MRGASRQTGLSLEDKYEDKDETKRGSGGSQRGSRRGSATIPCSVSAASFRGCSNSQHSCVRGPHVPLIPVPSSLRMLIACSMTTYGVSDDLESLPALVSLYSFEDEIGAMYAVYDDGIEMPSAKYVRCGEPQSLQRSRDK